MPENLLAQGREVASPCTLFVFAVLSALIGAINLMTHEGKAGRYLGGIFGLGMAVLCVVVAIIRLITDP